MPQCIECGYYMRVVIDPQTRTVNRCPHCDRVCDSYYEFDEVQKWIDVGLLRRRGWAHILFNELNIFYKSLYIALLCCFIEALVVRSNSVLQAHAPPGDPTSLHLVRIIKGPYFSLMDYTSTLPRLVLYSVQEYVLTAAAAAWMGSVVHSAVSHPLRRWVFVTSLATSSKLTYTFFLIWVTPSYLLPIVDLIYVLWLARGFRTLLLRQSWALTFSCVAVCWIVRALLRYASSWAPQLCVAL